VGTGYKVQAGSQAAQLGGSQATQMGMQAYRVGAGYLLVRLRR
jgi:hypothetical protein